MAGEVNRVVILQSGQISGTNADVAQVADLKKAIAAELGVDYSSLEGYDLSALQSVAQEIGLNVKDPGKAAGRAYVQSLSPEAQAELHQISAMYGESVTSPTGALSPGLQARWADFIAKQAVNGDVDVNALVMEVMRESYIENQKDLLFYAQKVKFYNELKKKIREELTHARQELAKHAGEPDEAALQPPYKAPTIYTEFTGQPEVVVKDWEGTKGEKHYLTPEEMKDPNRQPGRYAIDRNGDGKIQEDETFTIEGLATLDSNRDGKVDDRDADFAKVHRILDKDRDGSVADEENDVTKLDTLYQAGVLQIDTPQAGATSFTYTSTDGVVSNKKELESYIEELEEKLNTAGDDQQLANVDLQNMQQRQQQLLQAMSNVSKMLHDTAMAIIRKIGG